MYRTKATSSLSSRAQAFSLARHSSPLVRQLPAAAALATTAACHTRSLATRALGGRNKPATRFFSSTSAARYVSAEEAALAEQRGPRDVVDYDVVIVGGGPAGLAAAIRLKQLAAKNDTEINVVVVEKGGEIGAHTLSGACIETGPLEELFPDWKELGAPLNQPALEDHMKFLTEKHALPLPHPPQMNNAGNYIVSLSNVVKWLGEKAEELGVDVFPATAASEIIYCDNGSVRGIATRDAGVDKTFKPKDSFTPGIELHGKVTLFAEGCHGSLTKGLIRKLKLRDEGKFQTYGLGIKEVWEVDPSKHTPGKIIHTMGYPLDYQTYGGGFIYHMEDNKVSLGLVVGLDYKNPYLSPYKEFQRFKAHPLVTGLLKGGRVLSYGARALVEGGLQSVPKLFFPGGALIGDTAGFMNVPKIKGTHNAMRSGILAADSAYKAIVAEGKGEDAPVVLSDYEEAFKNSQIYKELHEVRNIRPSFHTGLGIWGGMAWAGLDSMILKGRVPFTFQHKDPDHSMMEPASMHKPIDYPKPDGEITFDILTSVSRTGTNHAENQPVHLRLADSSVEIATNLPVFAGPEQKFCPAGVYEYVDDDARPGHKRFQINSQNCIHCKTCDIKDPSQNINWTVPEGGDGPQYVDT
ncbi:hypothetical protein GGF39_001890 [Coemansia sp. RSA 1721]|nr:hypothetical protein GGF39_001890 [Coemansia sp. RSA 1721]